MLFDWQPIEDQLFECSRNAILRFAQEHATIKCSFFAYYADPTYGHFFLNFDTPENALEAAQEHEQDVRSRWYASLGEEEAWRYAETIMMRSGISDYGPDTSRFTYSRYDNITINELDALCCIQEHEDLELYIAVGEGYLEGNVSIVLWKVVERLVKNNMFSQLLLTSPFRVGFQFHEETIIVLRILNWPQHQVGE